MEKEMRAYNCRDSAKVVTAPSIARTQSFRWSFS